MVVALLVAVFIIATPACRVAVLKTQCFAHGAVFLLRSKDLPSKFSGSNCFKMNSVGEYTGGKRTIHVVFIRHGQSVWNSLFNSFNMGWPIRAAKAFVRETVDFFSDPFASVIVDSPLSSKGRTEANDLAGFLRVASNKFSYDPTTSTVVCSNLRRAMETALVGLSPRLSTTHERILMDSALQEGSKNIDAQTLSTERRKIAPCRMGPITDPVKLITVFDPRLNEGDKKIGVDVYKRMDVFIQQLFGGAGEESITPSAGSSNAALQEVIVVGHSGYFRNFFRRFLPQSSTHVSKRLKMQNCAVVAFNLTRIESTGELMVEESSIKVLYRGFK